MTHGTREIKLQAEKQRMIFRQTSSETNGQRLEIEAYYKPGGQYPPEHYHPIQDEHFEVLSGTLNVRNGNQEQVYTAGQRFTVPRCTPHTMRNGGPEEATVLWEVRPALKTQTFYETLAALAAAGQTDAHGTPGILQMAVLLQEYQAEFVPVAPAPVRWALINLIAPLGRLWGYRGHYDGLRVGAIGLGQGQAEVSIWIDRSPEDVYRFIADYSNDTRWRKSVSKMTPTPRGQAQVGTVTDEELEFLGQAYVTRARITDVEPNKRLRWEAFEGQTSASGWRIVAAEGRGTRFTSTITLGFHGAMRWLAPLLTQLYKRQMQADLVTLKGLCETMPEANAPMTTLQAPTT